MNPSHDELHVRALLAPLSRVEPATLPCRRRDRRRALIVAVLATALLATGVAIAAGVNPFAGIRAAGHAQTSRDVLDPAALARIGPLGNGSSSGHIAPDSSRLLGRLTAGRSIYVATTTTGDLCVLVTQRRALELVSCGHPLTRAAPVTVTNFVRVKNGPHATPPLSYGIARDDVTAVSFTVRGKEHVVRVKHNIWFYEGHSNVLASITVHFADGRTRTLAR